ncbi:DNA polymerase III subunit beta [Patescibacteria group bacterium]|nr:DNA polymerase III subunit beta [Patescibacteria group bacterium]
MTFECTKENLQHALAINMRGIDNKASLPILSHILFEAREKQLKLLTTNLEIGITSYVSGVVKEEGRCAVPAKILYDYIATMPLKKVTLTTKEDALIVESDDFSTSIQGSTADDFPLIPEIEKANTVYVRGDEVKHALSQIIYAASRDESRPELAGIYGVFSKRGICFVATDGHRLAEVTVPLSKKAEEITCIIPGRTAQEIVRILPKVEEEIVFKIDDGQIQCTIPHESFSGGRTELVSKLVNGKYPEYQAVIPEDYKASVVIDRQRFINSLKTSSLFSKSDTNEVQVTLDKKKKRMDISAEASSVGSNVSRVELEDITGTDLSISFNVQYLLDGLSVIDTPQVNMSFSEEGGAALITPKQKQDTLFRYVVMPLDVN